MTMNTSNPEELAAIPQPAWETYRSRIDEYLDGYRAFSALKISLEMGLFDRTVSLAGPEEIASELGTDAMLTKLLCASLAEMELLHEKGGKYANTDAARHYLVSASPYNQIDSVLMSAHRASRWEDLGSYLKDGPEVLPQEEYFDEAWISSIAMGSKGGSVGRVIKYLEEHVDLPEEGTLIDVGGGHGLYVIGLCARHRGLRGRVFDRQRILTVAERYSQAYGIPLELLPGDLYECPIPGGNDIMYTSFNPACSDPELVPNIDAALEPGGTLVVRRHTKTATEGALRNLEWNLRVWDGFERGGKRHSAAATDDGDRYIEGLSKRGIRLLSREAFDGTSEMLVFRKG